jgi:hypothetical protein
MGKLISKLDAAVFFSLNSRYVIPKDAAPGKLIDDASCLLRGAKDIVAHLAAYMSENSDDFGGITPLQLAGMLYAASSLIEMGANAMCAAHPGLVD